MPLALGHGSRQADRNSKEGPAINQELSCGTTNYDYNRTINTTLIIDLSQKFAVNKSTNERFMSVSA